MTHETNTLVLNSFCGCFEFTHVTLGTNAIAEWAKMFKLAFKEWGLKLILNGLEKIFHNWTIKVWNLEGSDPAALQG